MRLLFVADGRSPIALSWIRHFIERGEEVHLASTFSCELAPGLAGLEVLPVAFSSMKKAAGQAGTGARRRSGLESSRAVGLRTAARQWLGPLTIPRAGRILRDMIGRLKP